VNVATRSGAERTCAVKRQSDGVRQVVFVFFRERGPDVVRGKCGARGLAEESGEESWKQYRFVNGGAEDPKGTERRRE